MTTQLTHHHLTAELVNDEHDKAIMLTQQEDGYNEPSTLLAHPFHLRAVCEQFGIIASGQHAEKTIATVQRRMMGLRERIDDLAYWMANHSDHKHADLSYETTQLRALQYLAGEWCADFESGLPKRFGEDLPKNTAPAVEPDSTSARRNSAPTVQAALL